MANRSSRHAQLASYRRRLPALQQEVELYQPRLRDVPPGSRSHRVRPGERLDLLAFRYYDDPHQYWRLADANPDRELPELAVAGRRLEVPERR
jgi:hypothetical protein